MKLKILLILSLLITGCTTASHYNSESLITTWNYADLRLIDPVDVPNPEQDILALYTRIQGESFLIRLDFFDLVTLYGQDIYFLFDTNPGGTDKVQIGGTVIQADIQWDYALYLPAKGNAVMHNHELLPVYGLNLMTSRDFDQAYFVVSINKSNLPVAWNMAKIQAFTTSPANSTVSDRLQPVLASAPSPPRAEVMFLFWNVFSAETPARTLRSWYGAHSGPNSSRHGLKYLLDAAEETRTPLFFLDFPSSDDIPGIDYIGASSLINNMIKKNAINKFCVDSFDSFIYCDEYICNKKYDEIFGITDYAQLQNNLRNCYFPTQLLHTTTKSSDNGIDCRFVFNDHAISNNPIPIIIGGDFSRSRFGDPSVANSLFLYIQNHPWIKVLSHSDLLSVPDFDEITTPSEIHFSDPVFSLNLYSLNLTRLPQEYTIIYKALLTAPDNKLTEHAIQTFAYLASFSPVDILPLATNYVHQLGHILAAAQWVENPESIASCETDPDFDGENECILANQQVFLIVEPDGGYIPYIFSLDVNGPHQIIGPSWEFLIGMSDPSEWDFTKGIRSDPGQFLGAFTNESINNNEFSIYIKGNRILIESSDMAMRKSVIINDNTIHVQIQNSAQEMSPITIPLTIDPWIRYTPNWGDKYSLSTHDTGIHWGITDSLSVDILTSNQLNTSTFNATHDDLFYPEDPNHDYSPGHYLPYPMALFEIQPSENLAVQLVINP